MKTEKNIWFCLSHKNLDLRALEEAQCDQFKRDTGTELELSLSYRPLPDNTGYQKNSFTPGLLNKRKAIRGLIAEVSEDQYRGYYSWVMQQYSRSATSFPFGIHLRATPLVSREFDYDTNEKVKTLMQRQEWFQASVTDSMTMAVSNIDRTNSHTKKSLRQHLMEICIFNDNLSSLFVSIDQVRVGKEKGAYKFTYPTLYQEKASRIVSNLTAYCLHTYGEEIMPTYFPPAVVSVAKKSRWDEEAGRVISQEEQNCEGVIQDIDALVWIKEPAKPTATPPDSQAQPSTDPSNTPPVINIETGSIGKDSVSAFGDSLLGGANRSKPNDASRPSTVFTPVVVAGRDDASVARSTASFSSKLLDDTVATVAQQGQTLKSILELLKQTHGGQALKDKVDSTSPDSEHDPAMSGTSAEAAPDTGVASGD